MIISHKHKFIFFKTVKTAGTSIELALSQLCGPDDVITPVSKEDEPLRNGHGPQNWRLYGWFDCPLPLWRRHRLFRFDPRDYGFYNHITAGEVSQLLNGRQWADYFKFTFDRNPWDRQVSHYHYVHRATRRPPSFADYLRREPQPRIANFDIYSLDGEPCVDFIGRYETLDDDLDEALRRLGIRAEVSLPRAKGEFRKERRPYQDYYDRETRALIADWYAGEIALLGYRFE